ncbi:MAG: PAS domain-containing protein [Chloroflexi bacterium]|nr:PAS domain-containing protein [Chloroflexota bacterium]
MDGSFSVARAPRGSVVEPEATAGLESIFESLPDGVLTYDSEGRVGLLNAAGRHLFGLPADAHLAGLSHQDLVAVLAPRFADADAASAALQPTGNAADRPVELELVNPRCWVRAQRSEVQDRQGRVVARVLLLHDWTERKLQERYWAEYLAVAAHDLKTPLANVKAYTQLALRRLRQVPAESATSNAAGTPLEQALGYLRTVNEEADKLTRLITELLEFWRSEQGHSRRCQPPTG